MVVQTPLYPVSDVDLDPPGCCAPYDCFLIERIRTPNLGAPDPSITEL